MVEKKLNYKLRNNLSSNLKKIILKQTANVLPIFTLMLSTLDHSSNHYLTGVI